MIGRGKTNPASGLIGQLKTMVIIGSGKTATLEALAQSERLGSIRKLTEDEKVIVFEYIQGDMKDAEAYLALRDISPPNNNNNNNSRSSMHTTSIVHVDEDKEKKMKKLEKQARKAERQSKRR